MTSKEQREDMEKANGRIKTTLTEVVERLMSVLNAIKAGNEVRDSNLTEIRAVAALLGKLAERYPSARTKKAMTPAELVEYATGQLNKAEGEGDKAGPRLDALRDVLASAVEVLKQSAGGAEDLESARIQVEVYQETGLTSVPEEKEIAVSDLQAGGSIDELLAKVDKLRKELRSKEGQTSDAGTGDPPEKSVSWPADMTAAVDKADVKKSAAGDNSWGSDPTEVRGPAS